MNLLKWAITRDIPVIGALIMGKIITQIIELLTSPPCFASSNKWSTWKHRDRMKLENGKRRSRRDRDLNNLNKRKD